jgi:hypothetical protein
MVDRNLRRIVGGSDGEAASFLMEHLTQNDLTRLGQELRRENDRPLRSHRFDTRVAAGTQKRWDRNTLAG